MYFIECDVIFYDFTVLAFSRRVLILRLIQSYFRLPTVWSRVGIEDYPFKPSDLK